MLLKRKVDIETAKADIEGVNSLHKTAQNKSADRYITKSDSSRFVKILDLREGNEESSEETTGCKASVYAEFDDCPRVGKFVKLLDLLSCVKAPSSFSVNRGKSKALKITLPAGFTQVTKYTGSPVDVKVTFKSSNPKVATLLQ